MSMNDDSNKFVKKQKQKQKTSRIAKLSLVLFRRQGYINTRQK